MKYSDVIMALKEDADRRARADQCDQSSGNDVKMYYAEKSAIKALEYLQKQGIENLAALAEEMEHFNKLKKHETQYMDNMDDPLEPLKISSALSSEIMKHEYRKVHNPESISILDYTVIEALKEALEKRTGEDG